eukprot:CAMPEP_0174228966 /NCGR_PEP_ID=MMETSP0417-20130205/44_1 /TAXON_ID=242541 /ORGANISM="Mayorella sp, Strain BSH-02190019" /LENGTH=194 /DNA_ID=CAMNT_0015306459 /DNA_START=129 /DNA_END=713 /DNA_ORIENTATION=-
MPPSFRARIHGSEITATEEGKITSIGNFFEYMYYDANRESMRVDEFADVNHERFNVSTVYRYDLNLLYYLMPSGCYYLDLTPPFDQMPPRCVPHGMEERQFSIGAGIPCSSFHFRRWFGPFNIDDRFAVIHAPEGECIPFQGNFIEHYRPTSNTTKSDMFWEDVQVGEIDPFLFTVPPKSDCTAIPTFMKNLSV